MICYEVRLNGGEIIVAGGADVSVLTAILTSVPAHSELDLSVGGLGGGSAGQEHLRWIEQSLRVGDVVEIRVVDVQAADAPAHRIKDDPDLVEQSRRRYYEELRNQYEPDTP